MINNCADCKQKCCQTGPGPHKLLSPEDYLENFNTVESYNTKCAALDNNGNCSVWGTNDFPIECRTHVCTNRSFTERELSDIENVFDRECSNCNASYVLMLENDGRFTEYCENCGHAFDWVKQVIQKGKKQRKDYASPKKTKK